MVYLQTTKLNKNFKIKCFCISNKVRIKISVDLKEAIGSTHWYPELPTENKGFVMSLLSPSTARFSLFVFGSVYRGNDYGGGGNAVSYY